MKQCRKCQRTKPLSEFYRDKKTAGSYMNDCKNCRLASNKQWKLENIKYVQEYNRKKGNTPEYKAANRRSYRKTRANPIKLAALRARQKEWIGRNKTKRRCHVIANNAITARILIRQPCAHCGSDNRIEAHHEDYSKPLEVVWLCKKCHGLRHREINEENRK